MNTVTDASINPYAADAIANSSYVEQKVRLIEQHPNNNIHTKDRMMGLIFKNCTMSPVRNFPITKNKPRIVITGPTFCLGIFSSCIIISGKKRNGISKAKS